MAPYASKPLNGRSHRGKTVRFLLNDYTNGSSGANGFKGTNGVKCANGKTGAKGTNGKNGWHVPASTVSSAPKDEVVTVLDSQPSPPLQRTRSNSPVEQNETLSTRPLSSKLLFSPFLVAPYSLSNDHHMPNQDAKDGLALNQMEQLAAKWLDLLKHHPLESHEVVQFCIVTLSNLRAYRSSHQQEQQQQHVAMPIPLLMAVVLPPWDVFPGMVLTLDYWFHNIYRRQKVRQAMGVLGRRLPSVNSGPKNNKASGFIVECEQQTLQWLNGVQQQHESTLQATPRPLTNGRQFGTGPFHLPNVLRVQPPSVTPSMVTASGLRALAPETYGDNGRIPLFESSCLPNGGVVWQLSPATSTTNVQGLGESHEDTTAAPPDAGALINPPRLPVFESSHLPDGGVVWQIRPAPIDGVAVASLAPVTVNGTSAMHSETNGTSNDTQKQSFIKENNGWVMCQGQLQSLPTDVTTAPEFTGKRGRMATPSPYQGASDSAIMSTTPMEYNDRINGGFKGQGVVTPDGVRATSERNGKGSPSEQAPLKKRFHLDSDDDGDATVCEMESYT